MKKIILSKKQKGATMVEYGILVVLISVVAILAIQNVGTSVNSGFTEVDTKLKAG